MATKKQPVEELAEQDAMLDEDEYDDEFEHEDSGVGQIALDMDQKSDFEMVSEFAQQDRLEGEPEEAEDDREESEEQAPVDMELVDKTVIKVNELHRKNVDNGKLEIGEFLLDTVFHGNILIAGSHNPMKSATFAKIAESPKLEVDARTLGAWVRAAYYKRDLVQDKGLNLAHLSTYHYVELAAVKDENKRVALAKKAQAKKLTVQGLRDEIKALRHKTPSEAQKMRAELEKRIRYSLEFPQANGLKEFTADLDLVKEQYPEDKALKRINVVKKCLANLRTHEDILTQFLINLQAVVDDYMNPSTD
jgi:hypothetical protein